MKHDLDDFKVFNRQRRIHTLAQVALLLMLIVGCLTLIPYAQHIHIRLNTQQPLRPEDNTILCNINEPVELYLLTDLTQPTEAFRVAFRVFASQLKSVLKERLSYKVLHTLWDKQIINQLKEHYHCTTEAGILLITHQRVQFLPINTFYKEGYLLPIAPVILNGIQTLLTPRQKALWLVGHQEIDGQSTHPLTGGSVAYQLLKQMNYDIQFANTCETSILNTIDLLLIFGPRQTLLPAEITAIQQFIQQQKSVCICLSPENPLQALLATFHVQCEPSLLNEQQTVLGEYEFVHHSLTQPLIDTKSRLLFGTTIPLNLTSNHPQLQPFVYQTNPNKQLPNSQTQSPQRTVIGYESNKASFAATHKGKIIILGCSDWLNNQYLNYLNNTLFLQCIGRYFSNNPSLSILKENINNVSISLDPQLFPYYALYYLIAPLIACLLGLTIFIVRKR